MTIPMIKVYKYGKRYSFIPDGRSGAVAVITADGAPELDESSDTIGAKGFRLNASEAILAARSHAFGLSLIEPREKGGKRHEGTSRHH